MFVTYIFQPVECADYISIVAKFDNRATLKLDGKALTGTWTTVTGKTTYAYYNQPLTPGFHTLTHDDNNEAYMAWIYGHGIQDFTGYGYMAGYKSKAHFIIKMNTLFK